MRRPIPSRLLTLEHDTSTMRRRTMSEKAPRKGPQPTPDQLRSRISELERVAAEQRVALERERSDNDVLRSENAELSESLDHERSRVRSLVCTKSDLEAKLQRANEDAVDLRADSEQMGDVATRALEHAKRATERAREAEALAGIEPGSTEGSYRDPDYAATVTFPLSHEAIWLLERMPDPFGFDRAHEAFAEALKGKVGALLQELLDEGCVRQEGERFMKTGHRPFF